MWHNQLLKLKTKSYKRDNTVPIFTGYYGMPNQDQENFVEFNRESGYMGQLARNSTLYQKNSSKKLNRLSLNREQLYEKYKSQKRAESEFYVLQSQITQTENLISHNPHLVSYYAAWMKQAKETLKEYASVIESPDNVSFSSVYGYSKDEELITLYRNPQFSSELKQLNERKANEIRSLVPYNNNNMYRYSKNLNKSTRHLTYKNNMLSNSSNRSLQLMHGKNRAMYFRNVISYDDCQAF